MAQTTFSLTYDGAALRDHQMPVRELSPALFALGELFVDASKILYPDRDPVGLNVRATDEGSFLIHLALRTPAVWDQIIDLLGGQTVSALSNLENVVLGSRGLLAFIQKRKNREIALTEPAAEPGMVKVTYRDGASVEVHNVALGMGEKLAVRRATQAVVGPLAVEGIEVAKFNATRAEFEPVTITKEDLPAFDFPVAPILEEAPSVSHRTAWLEIAALRFAERNVWRFSDGSAYFSAVIEDEGFLHKVDNREIGFLSGDSLYCELRIEQARGS
ncbi:MAG TPA: hypothetical protein VHC01_04045, partial [Gaiellaceae bacterium]|nr:hypothetical protein [Gaiellaceae bacterium]